MPDNRHPPPAAQTEGDCSITLSSAQISHVVRKATGGGGLRALFGERMDELQSAALKALKDPENNNRQVSRSTLHALHILGGFAPAGTEKRVTEVASELGISPSTTHRYATTLLQVGLLERDPNTRLYRIPLPAEDQSALRPDAAE